MPTTTWRIWAVVTYATGAIASFAVSQAADTATIVVRTVLGGMFGLAIGMYAVESVWARRARDGAARSSPTSPH